jgi:BirA family biotin operon repressor/biotin-[acetyl-CoA-carboxylase] ligase
MKLDPSASAAGVRLIMHEALGSTNAEALRCARGGESGPLWIAAVRQTAGRGRRGRAWISPAGNLYASLLLTAPAPVRRWPELSFVAALAVHDAILELAPGLAPMLGIKWPNDLLLDDAKLAGILVEGECADPAAVAVGIGVNCTSHPTEIDQSATDLACAGESISPDRLLLAISSKMLGRLEQWRAGADFSIIRMEWLARARGRGQEVAVRLAAGEVIGRFEGLDESGALILRMRGGDQMRITTGDVYRVDGLVRRGEVVGSRC